MWQSELFLLILLSVTVSGVQEFYCDTVYAQTISGVSEGVIKTVQAGSEFYQNNLKCEWEIEAREDGRIQLIIESMDLQWSPTYATCSGYDYLEIREGLQEESTHLTSVCHAQNPHSVISKGRHLYLKFSSNHQNFANRRGIKIRFKLFKNDSCPPDWFQVSPSSEDCIMIGINGKTGWSQAQDVCNYNRANIASILSESEYSVILAHGRNISSTLTSAWIGLRNSEEESAFKWIDRHNLSYKRELTGIRYNTYCAAQDFKTGDWSVLECDSKQNYICKCKKDGSTVLYQAEPPTKPPEEDDTGTKIYLVIIIIVVLIVLSCVGAVLFYCCYWRKRMPHAKPKKKRDSVQNENISNAGGAQFTPLEQRSSAPTAPPQENVMLHDPQMVAPPTYEESRYDPVALSPSTY